MALELQAPLVRVSRTVWLLFINFGDEVWSGLNFELRNVFRTVNPFQSDTLGCWPQRTLYKNEFHGEGGSYNSRPYQILDSFKCKTAGMGYWSEWSNWSDCSKKGSTNRPVNEPDVEAVPRSLILSNVSMEFPKALGERLENASMQKLETLGATIQLRLK